jgi:methylglutaconyl-CoA hydratase
MTSVLLLESLDEATALLTLNRPERRNALSIELMESLCRSLETLAGQPRRRIVILRGVGPVFCAGLDLHEAAKLEQADESAHWVARTFETLTSSRLVTIAAAHGAAYGGGVGLLACCDLVVASEDLRVCSPEVRRGLVAALAAAALMTRLGESDLRQLLMLAEPIDAQRARSIGLVDRVVAADRLLAEARQMAATLVQGAPDALRQTKRLLGELRSLAPSQRFARALEFHQQARLSEEAREGMAAFREHREPRWPT